MDITENDVQNHLHNNKDNRKEEEQKNGQEKNIIHKSKKQKRKDKLKADDDAPISKKIKIDNVAKEDSQIKIDTNNIKENNEKIIDKSASRKKNKNKSSQFHQINTGKRKPDYDDPTMSLNAERLKIYGINAKKLKNKLKYGNKKL